MAIKGFEKLVRSVRAFGRGITGVPSPAVSSKGLSIGLALGGGFARGIVHVGVLKVLEEENIPVRFIAGTSVGALIGAAYCSGVSPAELEEIASRVRFRDLARWTLSRYGFATNQRMIGFLSKTLKVATFEELRIPLAVTATDFASGEGVVFRSGPLADPVRDMGADRVLAVSLRSRWANEDGPRHIFDVIGQCFSIAQDMNCAHARLCADLVLEPDVTGYRYDDFEQSPELVRIGEEATRKALPEIRKWMETPAQIKTALSTPPLVSPARST